MDITTYIIECELLARRTVKLPFIGILYRARVGSSFAIDRSHLTPPRDYLALTPDTEQQGEEFIAMIATQTGVSTSEAIESYNRWYSSSIDEMGAVLSIESICKIDLMSYTICEIDPSFDNHLCPVGEEPISIGRPLRSRGIESLPIIDSPIAIQYMEEEVELVAGQTGTIEQVITYSEQSTTSYEQRRATAPRSAKRHSGHSSTSSTALTLSIIIASAAALYIIYYVLSAKGIINL